MALLDHFHPPLSERRHWQALHSHWASTISDALNEQGLPTYLHAEPTVTLGNQFQIDVATLPKLDVAAPTWVMPGLFPDSFEVRVMSTDGGPRLVAAIELVSPSNKDRPESRRAFAIKCANFLCQGISCIVMDVVTNRHANLHNEMMSLLGHTNFSLPPETSQYATAYRPVKRHEQAEIDVWTAKVAVGEPLPSLPLYVAIDLAMQVDFAATYAETCRRLRIY